jgi:hypothetical protein
MSSSLIGLVYSSFHVLGLFSVLQIRIIVSHVHFSYSLLLRRECCSFSNGEYVKAGLAELEHWCYKATDEVPYCTAINFSFLSIMFKYILTSSLSRKKKNQYAGPAWDELKHIRQAIGFLVFIYLQSAWYMFKWSE